MTCVHVCVTHDRTVLVHPPQWIVCRIFVDSSLRIGSIVRDVKTPCGQNAEAKIVHTSTRESSTSVVALQITQTLCHGHWSSHTHTHTIVGHFNLFLWIVEIRTFCAFFCSQHNIYDTFLCESISGASCCGHKVMGEMHVIYGAASQAFCWRRHQPSRLFTLRKDSPLFWFWIVLSSSTECWIMLS